MPLRTVLRLFVAQGVRRVAERGFEGLVAYGQQGDHKYQNTSKDKERYAGARPVSKILQPPLHGIIGYLPGDSVGRYYPLGKFFSH